MQVHKLPIDSFGVVAAPLFAALLNQSGDRRKRRSAFNTIVAMCKGFGLIPKNAEVDSISLSTDKAGQITYTLAFEAGSQEPATTPVLCPPCPLLANALERMDTARNILTDGHPTPNNNWGMLDTKDLREKLAKSSELSA